VVVLFSIAFDPRGAFSQRDRRRRALRGHHVRLGQRAQPGLGARNPPPGAGRAAHGPRSRRGALPGQGDRQLSLRHHRANHAGAVFLVFYNLHIEGQAWLLALVLPLGTWALVANGIFFAALSIRSRNRELLLSLILFPIFIPALLAMVQATTAILTGESDPTLWIKLLLGYDIIFTTVSLLLFDVSSTPMTTGPHLGPPRLGHLVDMGCAPDHHPRPLAHLCQLSAAAPLCRRTAGADPGRRPRHLRRARRAHRLHVEPLVAHPASRPGLRRRGRLGHGPIHGPRFLWNMLAW
jgi:heme exporter protein B